MKVLVMAVFTIMGGPPVVTAVHGESCKPLMEQVVKSYGMANYIQSWSNSFIKAKQGDKELVVTCNSTK